MKISLRWLEKYMDVSEFFEEPEKLVEKLTHAGLEVEGVENQAQQFKNVVVGHVVEKGQHPDADRLSLCQVDVGKGEKQQIICGATNHKQGDKVVAALPGAVLPGDFAIKKSKIRGVESLGMLCSDSELGLSSESEGIIILPEDAPVGESFAGYYGLDDVIFELSVTPNRADCLSHFGLVREISCLLNRPYEFPLKGLEVISKSTQKEMDVSVEAPELCPRYAGRMIEGVKITESPDWLKRSLESIGLNSINNVVDVTNFVMMELGQPMHAFDADQLDGRKILVDHAKEGEKFIALDGSEIELQGEELVIRDGEKPVALAGVIGGINSGVSDSTCNIFLESAYFTISTVRKTARKFGIETDSAYRFSRGVDPEGVVLALNRATQLIQEVAGGKVLDDPYDIYPNPLVRDPVEVRIPFIAQKLGYSVSQESFEDWMRRLGCKIDNLGEDKYSVHPPAYRWDLFIEEDFVEEFARLNGYDQIPETLPPLSTEPSEHNTEFLAQNMIHKAFQGQGFQQVVNHAFLDGEFQAEFLGDWKKLEPLGFAGSSDVIQLKNPLSEELGVMRSSVLPSLVKTVAFNDRHENHQGQVYELGFSFYKGNDGEYLQESRVGLAMWGKQEGLWSQSLPLVYQMKAQVELFLQGLKSRSWKWQAVGDAPDFLHPGQWIVLQYEGRPVGFIGTLHPQWNEKLKMKSPCVLAEFQVERLMRGQPRIVKSKSPSRFPRIERDLAFLMPKNLPVGDVTAEIRKSAGATLVGLKVFDVYEGDKLNQGERSVAFRLTYQGNSQTLTDDQILDLQNKVINSVGRKFSISVR